MDKREEIWEVPRDRILGHETIPLKGTEQMGM
jgi:hypothetical protein